MSILTFKLKHEQNYDTLLKKAFCVGEVTNAEAR